MDITIDLDRSEYVKYRSDLMNTLVVPTISETKSALGEYLASIVFGECEEALRDDFGLSPPLKGAGDELWVSPSDLLIGKIVLKPPYTVKHIQALTHQGILEIGQDIEIKYWNQMEMEKEKALADQKRHLRVEFEENLKAEIKNVVQQEREMCQEEMNRMTEEFEATLIEELDKLESRLKSEYEELMENQEIQLRKEWEEKLRQEVQRTVENMTIEFLNELDRQKNIMATNFKLEIQKAHIQKGYDIGMEQFRCKESIRQLKHNLECKNVANMMYVLCMERRKCCDEKSVIEEHYREEVEKLNNIIIGKDKKIKKLNEEKRKQVMEVNLRETCLLEIIKQFQKFINFALRAAPTQAEFLLSIEKMMVFELADTVLKTNVSKLKPCNELFPWLSENIGAKSVDGLEVKDHHDCLNELIPPRPEGEQFGADEYLPAFNYMGKLYVREDFRNMVSQGIEISPSNELWSPDVEILINSLRKSVTSINEERESFDATLTDEYVIPQSKKSLTAQSSIQFKKSYQQARPSKVSYEGEKKFKSEGERKCSMKTNLTSLNTVDFSKIGRVEKGPTILAAANSIELILKKGSVRYLGPRKEIHETEENSDSNIANVEEEEIDNHASVNKITPKGSEEFFRMIKIKSSDHMDTSSLSLNYKEIGGSKQGDKNSTSKRSMKNSLVMSTRDSIILKKTSLVRKSTEFRATPKDSIEVQKDSKYDLRKKPSKLASARNSVEILRESKMKLREESAKCSKKTPSKLKSVTCVVSKDLCCEKYMKTKDSSEVSNMPENAKQVKRDSCDRSIKISHIEVIKADDSNKDTSVVFNTTPIVYETGSTTLSNVSQIYKSTKKIKDRTRLSKDRFLSQPKTLKILGDPTAKEHLQNSDEFTIDRIHSFIALIKDHPNLIRTFTSCTR